MSILLYTIVVPFVIGAICLLVPKAKKGLAEALALLASLFVFGLTIYIFAKAGHPTTQYFRLDALSGFILLATGLFGFLITLYSIGFMQSESASIMHTSCGRLGQPVECLWQTI